MTGPSIAIVLLGAVSTVEEETDRNIAGAQSFQILTTGQDLLPKCYYWLSTRPCHSLL